MLKIVLPLNWRWRSLPEVIAWLLQQGDDIVPIPGTKRVSYLLDNLGALDVKLTIAELDRIDTILPKGAASGDRYPAYMMQMVDL